MANASRPIRTITLNPAFGVLEKGVDIGRAVRRLQRPGFDLNLLADVAGDSERALSALRAAFEHARPGDIVTSRASCRAAYAQRSSQSSSHG